MPVFQKWIVNNFCFHLKVSPACAAGAVNTASNPFVALPCRVLHLMVKRSEGGNVLMAGSDLRGLSAS